MKKRNAIIAGILVIIIGLTMWAALRPVKPAASLTFLGYTNDVAGTRLATFIVSNCNSFVVRRQAGYWIEYPTPTGETNRASRWFSGSRDLNAGVVEIVAVPALTNQTPWRVLLPIKTDLGRVSEAMDGVKFMIFGYRDTFLDSKPYELRGEWMENK